MKTNPSNRNETIRSLLEELFAEADRSSQSSPHLTKAELDGLFGTHIFGFREILLVIVIARLIDPEYKASESFYDCNPRSLFEGPIRDALLSRGIPHKQSGPLNVAKAAKGINAEWATQRRPKDVAELVVELVQRIENLSANDLKSFAITLCSRFLLEAVHVKSLTIDVVPNSDPVEIYFICKRLIEETPDGGNTPQRIIGYLLDSYNQELETGIIVSGHLDRATTTNTTSKKPGDILETLADGTIIQIYEVTVKRFDLKRVQESFDSIDKLLGGKHSEIIVICRSEDVPEEILDDSDTVYYLGTLRFKGLTYRFIDIEEWMIAQLLRMSPNIRAAFYNRLHEYISDLNTAEKVKNLWRELHTSEAESERAESAEPDLFSISDQ